MNVALPDGFAADLETMIEHGLHVPKMVDILASWGTPPGVFALVVAEHPELSADLHAVRDHLHTAPPARRARKETHVDPQRSHQEPPA